MTLMVGGKKFLDTVVLIFHFDVIYSVPIQRTCATVVVAYISYSGYAPAPNVFLPRVLSGARSMKFCV